MADPQEETMRDRGRTPRSDDSWEDRMTRNREIRQRRSGRMFDEVASEWLSRRTVLEGVLGATIVSFFSGSNLLQRAWARSESALLGFTGVPTSRADTVTVPPE